MLKAAARKLLGIVGAAATRTGLSPITTEIDGIRLRIDLEQTIDMKYFVTRQYEAQSLRRLMEFVRPGDTVIDVGANIGIMALHAARKAGDTGQVFAFEPSRWTYERLNTNTSLNTFGSRITTENAAVGAETVETVELTFPQGYRLDGADTSKRQRVKSWALDDYMSDRPVNVIKIDTDGWEPQVFRGATRLIATHKPRIMFEYCPFHAKKLGLDPLAPIRILKEYGYRIEDETGAEADPERINSALPKFGSVNLFGVPAA